MRGCRPWLMALLIAVAWPLLHAATPEEQSAFNAARRAFADRQFDWAEREFASFRERFAGSDLVADAILLQAQCRFELKQFDGVLDLLRDRLGDPKNGDRYRYWTGQALLQKGDYETAVKAFDQLVKDHPGSTRAMEGVYGLAFAYYKLGRSQSVVDLLLPADGAFRKLAGGAADRRLVADAELVLAEALLELNRPQDAESALARLDAAALDMDRKWRHAQLLCRTALKGTQPSASLDVFQRAVTIASEAGKTEWLAEAYQLLGRALERQTDIAGAIAAYEKTLSLSGADRQRRESMLRIIDLLSSAGKTEETILRLQQFISQYPQDTIVDLAHLTIGELKLRDFYLYVAQGAPESATRITEAASNALAQAHAHLDTVVTNFPSSPHMGKALLARGWGHWGAGRLPESRNDFAAALTNLPPSVHLVTAHFKLGDTLLRLGDAREALSNYQAVIRLGPQLAPGDETLFQQGLYQVIQSATAAGDFTAAESAVRRLIEHSNGSVYAQPALLLVGESATDAGQSAEARRILAMFQQQWPHASAAPDVALTIARSYVQEKNWELASRTYSEWVNTHTNHVKLPLAAFSLGWVDYLSGNESGALATLTRFLEQFPNDALAPVAQTWVADHYFRLGDEQPELLVKAEEGYLRVFQNTNWTSHPLAYQARLSAARAATARQGYKEALGYLTNLINDASAPTNILGRAYFALGDVLMNSPDLPASERWARAIGAYAIVRQQFPEPDIRWLAVGRIGQCYLQLAAQLESDPVNLVKAQEAFQQVVDSLADTAMRANAKLGLAEVHRGMARSARNGESAANLETALKHALDVFYEKSGFYRDADKPNRFWTYQAGLTAAKIRIESGKPELAAGLYESMEKLFPSQKEALRTARDQLSRKAEPPPLSSSNGFPQ